MLINPEDGMGWRGEDEREKRPIGPPDASPSPLQARPGEYTDVPELIKAAMQGVCPTARPLEPDEPVKLSPIHVQMILDRASGWKAEEIAQKYDYTAQRVREILRHPYAEVILGAMMAKLADRMTDPIERMKAYAHEAIDVKVSIMRDKATPKALKNSVASDLLDRGGFGPRAKELPKAPEADPVPAEFIERLSTTLEESRGVASMDYRRHLITSKPSESGEAVTPSPESEADPSSPRAEASLGGSSSNFKVA